LPSQPMAISILEKESLILTIAPFVQRSQGDMLARVKNRGF